MIVDLSLEYRLVVFTEIFTAFIEEELCHVLKELKPVQLTAMLSPLANANCTHGGAFHCGWYRIVVVAVNIIAEHLTKQGTEIIQCASPLRLAINLNCTFCRIFVRRTRGRGMAKRQYSTTTNATTTTLTRHNNNNNHKSKQSTDNFECYKRDLCARISRLLLIVSLCMCSCVRECVLLCLLKHETCS